MTKPSTFAEVLEHLTLIVSAAPTQPELWGRGVTLGITCFKARPYDAVRAAEERGLENIRGVGRHHLIAEFEDILPDQSWLQNHAVAALEFMEEVGGSRPRINIDRGAA